MNRPRVGARVFSGIGAVALALVVTSCGSPSTSAPQTPAPESTDGAPTAVAGDVTTEQAAALCNDLEGQLQSWRTYTPTIGKTGLNGVIVTWIAQHGLNPIEFAQDRARIDAITNNECPEVRQGAIDALDIPDLASGLIGF
ncbi:MAG: hypothetical protein GX542_09900 [Rhodococcus sp.]|nr:hypothetical protein [Rhodococcus sp. (in: high G+C Gram-positive bacteria)]